MGAVVSAGLPAVPRVPSMPPELTPLEQLRWHWGDAYLIGRDDERGWWAARRDQVGAFLTAADDDDLGQVIRADYAARPVPRDVDAARPSQ
jgi:hypothetical protein